MDDESLRALLEEAVSADDVTRVELFPYVRQQTFRWLSSLAAAEISPSVPAALYTAALLDRVGMPNEADLVANAVAVSNEGTGATLAVNWRAVLAATRGRLAEAGEILRTVVDSTPLGLVSLVAVHLNSGEFDRCRELINRIRTDCIGTDDPRSDVLLAVLETQLERVSGSRDSLAEAVAQLRSIVAGVLADPDLSDLDEVALLAHLALADFDLAKTQGSRDDMLQAADTATLVTQVLAATVGLQHRTAVVLRTRAALCDFEAACESRQPETVAAAIATLVDCHHFICTAFGEQDRRAVTLSANIAAARLEHARLARSPSAARTAFEALETASNQVNRVLGFNHPIAVTIATNRASAAYDLARIEESETQARAAADLLEAAVDRSRALLGDTHPSVKIAQRELDVCLAFIGRSQGDDSRGGLALQTRIQTTVAVFGGFDADYVSSERAAASFPRDPESSGKGRRIVGSERQSLAKDIVKRYMGGESIRAIAASTGRSYGFVHRVLTESNVQLRQNGGARRRKKA